LVGQEDLLEKGFHLAYFIFPSRAVAIRILTGALNKLKGQRGRENRRAYWRDKYLKRGITRITREEADALQWLIFFESDQYEKEQENSGNHTVSDLVVRYIKNLVRMTTAMSSFHVNVGLHRLLHNYSTAETQRLYETVTERFLGADEYRRAKKILMTKLEKRFDGFLKTLRTQHGELRFEECPDQRTWADLVDACLDVFTPWSTCKKCPVPATFDPARGQLLPQLSEPSLAELGRDQVEIKRCHVFIDPVCYTRLATALALDPPEKRLALPRFFMQNAKNEQPSPPPQPPALSEEERQAISDYLSAQASRRRKASAQFVKVLVDGEERGRLDLTHKNETSFAIDEGAELVEIKTDYQGQELLLATQPVSYSAEGGFVHSQSQIFLKGRNRLTVHISPLEQMARTEDPRRAVVQLSYEPRHLAVAWGSAKRPLWLSAVRYSAATIGLVAVGWILATRTKLDHAKSVADNLVAPPAQTLPPAAAPAPAEQVIAGLPEPSTVRLTPDELIVRGSGGPDIPSVSLPPRPALMALELPLVPEDSRGSFRAVLRPFIKNTDILSEEVRLKKGAQAGAMLVFWVPSTALQAHRDYMVVVYSRTPSGKLEEVSTYTFRAVAEAK
jgi:hypothetical protein